MENIFNFIIDLQKQEFEQIILEWGYSSVALKHYLNKYEKDFEYGYAETLCDIKVNRLLPYTNNVKAMLRGDSAIYRLKLGIQAKAIIMNVLGDLEGPDGKHKFINECLRLFLRIDSTKTNLSFQNFSDIVNNTYDKIIDGSENDKIINTLIEEGERYKSKRISTLYHYTLEDFTYVRYEDNWKDAYNKWIEFYFPTILNKYKERALDEYKKELIRTKLDGKYLTSEKIINLIDKKKKELDLLKITKLSFSGFKSTISKLKNK